MQYPSLKLLLPVLCALAGLRTDAVVLAETKCENAIHYVNCSIPSDNVAQAQALNLPVFADIPAEPVTATAFIMPDGKVAGTPSYKDVRQKALADCLKMSEFAAAQIIGKPAWCALDHTSTAYFHMSGQDTVGMTLPMARFRFESATLAMLATLAPETETDQEPSISFTFSIDEKGNTTSINALDPRGETAAKDILAPNKASFAFAPGTKNGKPVATQVILRVEGSPKPTATEKEVPWFIAEASAQPAPKISKPYEGKEPLKVKCFLGLAPKGDVTSVRIDGSIGTGLALAVLNKVRNWKNPAHFEWDCKRTVAVVEFSLEPGATEFTLVGSGRPVSFVLPKVEKQADFRNTGLTIDAFEKAAYTYDIEADGSVTNLESSEGTNYKFTARMKNFVKNTSFTPAKIEDEAVKCSIEEVIGLKIGEYWSNTDALKW
jgi:hypothetical protein